MTTREEFAARAMQGMLAAFKHWPRRGELELVAELAVEQADLLAARLDQVPEPMKGEQA